MYEFLLPQLTNETLLLTVNNRLARFVQSEYSTWQQRQGHQAWRSPQILPLETWFNAQWQLTGDRSLLSGQQSLFLWQSLVEKSDTGHGLLRIPETAKQVADAYQLVQQWQLNLTMLATSEYEDVQAFASWAREYQTLCQQNRLLDAAELPAALDPSQLQLPERILLLGFEQFTPAIQDFLTVIGRSCIVENVTIPARNQSTRRCEFSSEEQELVTMAHWAHQHYTNSDATITCVIPDLANLRPTVARIFAQTFTETDNYNISLAEPLHQFPIVQYALRCLQFAHGDQRWQQYSALLRSPYINGYLGEASSRASLDVKLREIGELSLSPEWVMNLAHGCPQFKAILTQLPTPPDSQSVTGWQQYWLDILHIFGWPGERGLDSHEYQLVKRLRKLLDEFVSLQLLVDELDAEQAITHLLQLTKNTTFQVKSKPTRLQILGLLEAAALGSDHLWIQGLNDETLPAPLSPNPYLPVRLQRELKLPRTDPNHELQYATQLLAHLTSASLQVTLSYGQQIEARELSASPLILGVKQQSMSPQSLPLPTFGQLEQITDNQAPPVTNESLRGGSYLLKAQANCPFKAFAEIRLGANALSEPSQGLTSSERGELVHEILANIWLLIKTSDQLNVADPRIAIEVKKVLQLWRQRRPSTLSDYFTVIEEARLTQLVTQWLTTEEDRRPFTVVACEQKQSITFNGIPLNLRVDRIDELVSGERIIIDYKTGHANVNDWYAERPSEPQLLLYCMTTTEVQGISFAQVKPGDMSFKGVTATPDLLPGVKACDDWPSQVELWRSRLALISEEFLTGEARVDPQLGAVTCQYCQLTTLCRIHQAAEG